MHRTEVTWAPSPRDDGAAPPPLRPPATAARAGGLLLAALGAGGLAAVFVRRALEAGTALTGPWADAVGAWTTPGGLRMDDLVGLAAVLAGAALTSWFALGFLVAATCAGARAAGHAWVAGERLVGRAAPRLVRRALVLAAGSGVALAGAGLPAVALAPPPDGLGWAVTAGAAPAAEPGSGSTGPVPAATASPAAGPVTQQVATVDGPGAGPVVGPGAGPVAGPDDVAAPGGAAVAAAPAPVTVRAGDTLWEIAANHLPPGATAADVAAAWPAWYDANLAVVGPDPDVIRPGQHLVAPPPTDDAAPGVTPGATGGAASDGTDR